MVVGVWELILFLWSHPIISCLVLLLFSPPFFPIIVYFSPLLICTGLVVIAMVSMNMGQRAGRTDLRNDTRRVEPAVHVEMQEKPARESWLQWMKKKEEKAKAWVDSRFFSQDKWHFLDKSAPAPARVEEPSVVVDYNDNNEGYRISRYMELRRKALSLLQINRDVFPLLAEVAKATDDMSYSFVPESEDIKPIPRVQVPNEDPEFEISSFERRSPPSLVVPLSAVQKEFFKDLGVSSSLEEEEVLSIGKVQTVVEQEILSASKAGSPSEEPPTADYEIEPHSLNERATEDPLLLLPPKEVLPPVDMNDSICKASDEEDGFLVLKHNRTGETLKSIAYDEPSLFISDSDRITKVEALLVGNGTVSVDSKILTRLEAVQNDYGTRHIQPSSGFSDSRHMAEDVLVSPKLSASGEDRKACPEAEGETRGFSASNQPHVIRPSKRFIATEKIIFVDEPSEFTTVQSRSMVAETGKLGTSPIHERFGQIVAVEAELHESSQLKDRSPKGGLDENIESCRNVPPTTRSNSEPMALVSRSLLEASSLSETSALVVQSIPYPDELELLAAYMEPVMSTNNDAALTTSGIVLDKSYSLNNTFTGEDDDLTARFYALKKSMSLRTRRRWEEPITLRIAEANSSVVPVYIPDVVTRVERNPSLESLVVWEKKESRPRLSSGNVESVESITARLSKKFTPNLGNDTIVKPPPTRPAPALPAPALPPIDSTAPVQSDTNVEVTSGPVDVATGKNKLPAIAESPHSKKSLTSFLSRRREKLVLSYSSKGERGTKITSEATDTMTSMENSAEDRDEGSASTSSRLLKEKMISPLKRVFSLDANAGSSRKGDTLRESSVKSSPLKEKQSVINRSKTTVKKLFSSEGGLTKVEAPEVGKLAALDSISLKKSKSVSGAGEQHAECGEGQNGVVRDGLSLPTTPRLAPLSEVHGIEDVEVKSELQALPGIEAAACAETAEDSKLAVTVEKVDSKLAETVEEETSRLEPLPSSPTKERMILPSLDLGAPDDCTKVRGEEVTKGSSEKKFSWSWSKSEKHVLPAEQLDSKLEPPPSCTDEGKPPATLATGGPDDSAPVRGDRVTKSSREKKFLWSWTKSETQLLARSAAGSLTDIPEELDSKSEAKLEELSGTAAAAPAETAEDLDSKLKPESKKQLLPGIAAAFPAESAELEGKLEPVPSSPTEEKISPTTLGSGEPDESVKARGHRVTKSSGEKKFAWTWTKKTRSNEQQDTPVDQLRSLDDAVSFSGKGVDEEARQILLSPLPGFHSSPGTSLVIESADLSVPKDEDDSSVLKCVRPDSSSKLLDSQKTDSPHKKPSSSWWGPKADHLTLEKVVPSKEKKVSTSWWSRRNGRTDSKAVLSSTDLAPTDINSSSNNIFTDRIADSLEKSGPLSSLSKRGNDIDYVIPDDDDDVGAAGAAPRPRHRRERSDSLPASRDKFTRLRGRQTSLSEIALPRTPELELSPASSSGRAPHYNTIEKSTFLSMPRSYEGHPHEDVMKEKRNSDPLNGGNSNNTEWGTNSTPLTSYQIRPSSVRTLDLANEQRRVSPFHRTDLDVNSRLYRNSPSGAEIRITDKLKVPLEEVLSLLSTGDSDEQHNTMTADSGTGGAVAGDLRKASSSSSSEEEFSSEEEWSATSDEEDESQRQQQKQQQFNTLPPAGRIRRKLPHYIFSNGEATAN